MNISLTPELEQFVARKVSVGGYETPSAVVSEGLRLLAQRDNSNTPFVSSAAELREKVIAGIESLDRGEYSTLTADEVIARGRERVAKQQKNG